MTVVPRAGRGDASERLLKTSAACAAVHVSTLLSRDDCDIALPECGALNYTVLSMEEAACRLDEISHVKRSEPVEQSQ